MKARNGRLWFIFGACCFILLSISVVTSDSRARGASEIGHKPQKNPKLSTPLVLLSLHVKQESVRPAQAEPIHAPAGFSAEALPKPLRDAIHAGQMRISTNGEVQVYIEVSAIDPQNLSELRSFGVTIQIVGKPKPDKSKGEVLTKVPTVQGFLPVTMINQVSALPFVRFIRLPDYGFKNTGSVDSQGDQILQAAEARNQFGFDGTGIRVGVISDGIGGVFATGCSVCGPATAIPSPINLGDLPNATGTRNSSELLTSVAGGITAKSFRVDGDLEGCLGTCDTAGLVGAEGTAMLEIVHDLAPGAKLFFANFDTGLSFEQAVDYLTANTDVAVDDISFLSSDSGDTFPFDGSSSISANTANDLNTDANPIRGYFTAVGNKVFNHWGEPWTDSRHSFKLSCPAGSGGTSTTGDVQLFQATTNTKDSTHLGPEFANPLPLVMQNGDSVSVFLTWNDSFSSSSNDYDLYLYSIQNGILVAPLACSVNPQTGTQPPIESLGYRNTSGAAQEVAILIQNVANLAAPRNFDMFVAGYMGNSQDMNFYTPSGSVPAESDAGGSPVSVVSVGAIDQTQCSGPGNCSGSVEPYSSQGPTEATPKAASRMKPDVTATDDVSVTGAGGFGMNGTNATATGGCAIGETPCFFAGTSAAAPHAAAIAALALQASSGLAVNDPATQRANLRNFLTSTAVPLPGVSEPVPNNIEGFGLLDALAAVKAAVAALPPGFSLSPNPATVDIAAAGKSGSSTLTVSRMNNFTGSVSFACSVSPLPVNDPPTCFVNPPSVALSATTTTATATLRISTKLGLSSELQPANRPHKPGYFAASAGLALVSIFLLGVPRAARRWAASLGLVVLVFLGVTLCNCGGGGGSSQISLGTPSGAYTVTVTGSGIGSSPQSTSVSLTVQ